MPLYDYACENGHLDERFFHSAAQALEELPCRQCESQAHRQLSMGQGLCYFEEGRAQRIWNLEKIEYAKDGTMLPTKPVYVRSHGEHRRLMREQGVDFANRGRGYKGQWV